MTIRVLVGKPGLDGDDRGARAIAAALRDAGMEVIYAGLRASVSALATAAVQEDVDVIALSLPSSAQEEIVRRLSEDLKARCSKAPIMVGGNISTLVDEVRALAGKARPEQESKPAGIPVTRLDHTALCVKDMQASIRLIEDILGQPVAHQEFVEAQKIDAAFFDFPNGASLELVSPRGNAGLDRFLEKRGDGLHHLALRVQDIDEVLRRLDARGVPLIDKISRRGARGHKVAFLHPKAFGGTLLELVEAHEEPHD